MDATLARRKKEERKPARKPREAEPAPASTPEPEYAPAAGVPLFLRRAPASSAPAPAATDDTAAATPGEVAVAPADDALEREAESIAQAVAAAPAVTTPPAASTPPPAAPDAARVSKTYKKASASPDTAAASRAERASTPRNKAPAPADQASAPSPARVSKTYKKAPAAPDQAPAPAGERVYKAYESQPAAEPEQASKTYNNPPAADSVRAYKTYKNAPATQPAPASSTVPAFLRRTSSKVGAAGLGTTDAEQEREAETGAQARAAGASASVATPPRDGGVYKTYKNDAGAQSASAGSTTPAFLRRATSAAPEASSRAETHQPSRKLFGGHVASLGEPGGAAGLAEAQDAIQSADPPSLLTAASGAAGSAGAGSGAGDAGADDAPPPLLAEAEGAAAGSASGAAGGAAGDDAGDGDAAEAAASALAADVARDTLPFAPLPVHSRTDALTHSRTSVPHSRTSPGDPLPDGIRFILEAILGVDLAGVRIHKQPEDREAARELDARAFALGGDIWLGPGESDHDVGLMAHEVAHVLQGDHLLRRAPATAAKKPRSKDKKEKKGKASKTGDTASAPPSAGGAEAAASVMAAVSGGDAVSVPLHMPEPPSDLSADARARIREVKEESKEAAGAQADMPPPEAVTAGTRAAVAEPAAEAAGRAQGELVEGLDAQVQPSPEIEALCKKIYAAIKGKRPPDEDRLVEAKPEEMAQEAGDQLDGNVRGDTERVQGGYDAMGETPAGAPAAAEQSLDTPPISTDAPPVHATRAVPDAVSAENVSLETDLKTVNETVKDANLEEEAPREVKSGVILDVRETQGELAAKAEEGPAKALAAQAEARGKAAADMAALQAKALTALRRDRKETAGGVGTQQGQMVQKEALTRESVGIKAEGIFKQAQKDVRDQLKPLPTTAMERWNSEKVNLSREFKDSLADVKNHIDDRHSGVGGAILSGADYLFGLPRWITVKYEQAEEKFGNGVCKVIREISIEVNRVILLCEAIIERANKEIAKLYEDLPEDLKEWAAGEQARFAEQLDGLKNEAHTTRDDFNKDLVQRAGTAVQEAREEIHKLRQEAGGLFGRLMDAVGEFLEDPAKFIIEGLLELVGIPPASFWALINRISQVIDDIADDPLGFANNLLSGIAQGFERFFGAIGKHLAGGFFDWLFSGLGAVGVQLPSDFSLKGIVTFALQLMGITWDRVRRLLAKHIGEKNVALLEKAYELVAGLMEKGPEGIFEMIKEKLDPKQIIDQVIQAGIEFITVALIKNVSARIVLLFNPAGAIVQALEAIYRVLKWVFENAARIFSFVETVVNGMAQVVAGNVSGMAVAVEGALAKLIAPVIDFLADYASMGDLPEKIAEVIKGFQGWVEGILDTVIGFIATKAKDLLAALGIGKPGENRPQNEAGDGEVGKTLRFSAGGEGHRMWVRTEGARATLMVASDDPGAVEVKLTAWSRPQMLGKVPEEGEKGAKPRDQVRKRIGEARVSLAAADKLADQQAAAIAAQKPPAEISALDKQVEAAQQALADILTDIFNLFGHSVNLQVVYAAQIANADEHAREDLNRYLSPGSGVIPPKAYDSWQGAKTWLVEERPGVRDAIASPLAETHGFGTAAVPGQAIPAVGVGLGIAGLGPEFFGIKDFDKKVAIYVRNRKALINSGGGVFKHSADRLREQFWVGAKRGEADATLASEFASRLSGDKFAHLNTSAVQKALQARTPGAGWVAVFATGGVMLRAVKGTDTPLTMREVWKKRPVSPEDVVATVSQAVERTIRADANFIAKHLGGKTPAALAGELAADLVQRMADAVLYIVRHTDIPRKVEPGAHVILNPDEARTSALYNSIATRSKNTALSKLAGDVHHVVPLYLGGGHREPNLMRAEGDAAVAEGVEVTAHAIMHRFIDDLEVDRFMDDARIKLRENDLRKAFPDDALKIIIGTLYTDGRIDYEEQVALSYNPSLEEKEVVT